MPESRSCSFLLLLHIAYIPISSCLLSWIDSFLALSCLAFVVSCIHGGSLALLIQQGFD